MSRTSNGQVEGTSPNAIGKAALHGSEDTCGNGFNLFLPPIVGGSDYTYTYLQSYHRKMYPSIFISILDDRFGVMYL